MSSSIGFEATCPSIGGRGIGAGHVCICMRLNGHPAVDWPDENRPHGCVCGAMWKDKDE